MSSLLMDEALETKGMVIAEAVQEARPDCRTRLALAAPPSGRAGR